MNLNNIQTNPSVSVVDQKIKLARLLLLDPLEQLLHLHDDQDDDQGEDVHDNYGAYDDCGQNFNGDGNDHGGNSDDDGDDHGGLLDKPLHLLRDPFVQSLQSHPLPGK